MTPHCRATKALSCSPRPLFTLNGQVASVAVVAAEAAELEEVTAGNGRPTHQSLFTSATTSYTTSPTTTQSSATTSGSMSTCANRTVPVF